MVISVARDDHLQQIRRQVDSASALSRVSLGSIVSRIDQTLLAVADEVERLEREGGRNSPSIEQTLKRFDSRMPDALGLRIVDSAGIIRHAVSSIRVADVSIADRPQFIRMRDHPDAGLVISKPVWGRAAQTWIITLSRRLNHPDGSFAGDVHVAYPIVRLAENLVPPSLGPHGHASLWDADLTLLARGPQPFVLGEEGRSAASPPPQLRALIQAGRDQGAFRVDAKGGQIISASRLQGLPLWVTATISEPDALAQWRRETLTQVSAALLFALATFLGGWLLLRAWRPRHAASLALAAAHAEAQEARHRLELILGSAGDGICGVDPEGRITFINDAARRMLGWRDDEGIGLDLHEAAHHHRADGSEYPTIACPVWQTLHDGTLRHIPRDVHWRRDGTPLSVEFTVAPIIQDGRVSGAVTLFRDISRRLRAETEASRNLAITSALERILRFSLDDRPLASILHDALLEILNLPWLNIEERGGIFLAEPGTERLRLAAEHNLSAEISQACAVIDVGKCLCGRAAALREVVFASHVDERHDTRPDDMHGHGHYCVPILDGMDLVGVLNTYVADGHTWTHEEERFLKMAADTLAGIIRRKNVEQTLRDSESLSKALLNATIDGALLLDPDGGILATNAALAARFGKSPADMVGSNFFDLLSPTLAATRRAQFEQVLAEGRPLHSLDERDGLILDNRIYPVGEVGGRVNRVAIFSRDVTEQRQAQKTIEKAMADLNRSNADLEQFAYVTSHDMREPLRAITGHLQLLQRRVRDKLDDAAMESLLFAVDGAKRMDALILDLLDYSRIGRVDDKKGDVDLDEVMADCRANLSAAIADGDAAVDFLTPMPVAHGNRTELTRLFQNLIGNALKYRAPDRRPVVEVSATPSGGGWDIAVHDNGIGIAPEYFERIFKIFQRLHGRGQYEGTGIGLAVCRKIVERHGGHIRVESEPGKGSTFIVWLPSVAA